MSSPRPVSRVLKTGFPLNTEKRVWVRDYADTIVWKGAEEEQNNDGDNWDDDGSDDEGMTHDRYFKFEVSKTTEQEEGADIHPGFEFAHPAIEVVTFPQDADIPEELVDSQIETKPILGECKQGFLAARFIPYHKDTELIENEYSIPGLSALLKRHSNISFGEELSEAGLTLLLDEGGLRHRAQSLVTGYNQRVKLLQAERNQDTADALRESELRFQESRAQLAEEVRFKLAKAIVISHPALGIDRILERTPAEERQQCDSLDYLRELYGHYPSMMVAEQQIIAKAELNPIEGRSYNKVKKRFLKNHDRLMNSEELSPDAQEDLFDSILGRGRHEESYLQKKMGSRDTEEWEMVDHPATSDNAFLLLLGTIQSPSLQSFMDDVWGVVYKWAIKKLNDMAAKLSEKIIRIHTQEFGGRVRSITDSTLNSKRKENYDIFKADLQAKLRSEPDAPNLIVNEVSRRYQHGSPNAIYIRAHSEAYYEPFMVYNIFLLNTTESDRASLENDPLFIPRPEAYGANTFKLSMLDSIRHIQAIDNKFLLIVDQPDGVAIWLNDCYRIGRGQPLKRFPASERKYHFAVHEQQRLLAIVYIEATGRILLQLQAMDETFTSLHALGSPRDVTAWYQENPLDIKHICFAGGAEELCLIEGSGRVRIYSFVSQGFRASTLQLPSGISVHSAYSAPDDSALIIVERVLPDSHQIRLYHWDSFGQHSEGVILALPGELGLATSFCATSIWERSRVAFIAYIPTLNRMQCFNLQIKTKSTAYSFRSKEGKSRKILEGTLHNSFIDCYSDVWATYPVLSAIKRETITSPDGLSPSLTFVCDLGSGLFSTYFKRMIKDFEDLTKKTTERVLDAIKIDAGRIEDLDWNASEARSFKAGEWFVELLCLIPIHIAVARYNGFVPLKDGILDARQEQRLLGATVDQITDSITLGWYESILNSYMATKPVKVVSSMGEQSVGKSYMLNHLVDSSFAGSALRTTEGVWLSVCPTRDILVVALDFEGVHSIERSPQEDMLLVLFNTALSNLVLFRNNFALSRNVAHMFTSFQASTALLNPAANPKLFKGLLTIIIKDVVEGDKKEIVKEFSSKFRQIVSDEQEDNFITLLHASQLSVFPWPVIQSKPFYALFSRLKTLLIKQPTTHASAGEFLYTLKTLMAKLKAQDWGAIDQNLTKHRVALITAILPCALATGFTETEPEPEELKNLDNQKLIPWEDDSSDVIFSLSGSTLDRVERLRTLIDRWSPDAARHDVNQLSQYLESLAAARISHIRAWFESNISRFPADSTDIRSIKVILSDKEDLLRTSIQLCRVDCSDCHLPCLLPKAHSSTIHNCRTSHRCLDHCDYANKHVDDDEDDIHCSLYAGHGGPHLCKPTAHSCGEPCQLVQHRGCQKICMRVPGHPLSESHLCSARSHQCGMLCDLQSVKVIDAHGTKRSYSCPNFCSAAYDEDHDKHVCVDRLTCPITCQLCSRLCANGDHLHGLLDGAIHLCGQGHTCQHECESPGVCEINTEPRSVESTFSGEHGTFQFTKYTQIANRLRCAVPIAPSDLGHAGPHIHSTDSDVFHFCETKCQNCGYICQLPLNHTQPEHETSHGSMQNTVWAIDGSDDAVVQVGERKYAAREAGTPNICSSLCSQLGRHAHIDYCRSKDGNCQSNDSMHISERMLPNSDIPKDWISHKLFWARTGFKDPYSREEQAEFSRCDIQCAGDEHRGTATKTAQPSFCKLQIFHPPEPLDWASSGNGYVSKDGHSYACANPNSRQSYHIIFALDASYSMTATDLRPLPSTPSSRLIAEHKNNRFGAVLSAFNAFCLSRSAPGNDSRRDSYSVITFGWNAPVVISNDSTSAPDQLLEKLLRTNVWGKTHFDHALNTVKETMETHWHDDRPPAVVFLSDGQSYFTDSVMTDLCNIATARGKPLSFHAILFGDSKNSVSLRKMVSIASQVSRPLGSRPAPCGFSTAINTVRLADTFLSIAESLKKPRGSLLRS